MPKVIKREKFKVKSNSEKNKVYTVEILFGGMWQCDCIANSFGTECSHIKQTKNEIWLKNLTKN